MTDTTNAVNNGIPIEGGSGSPQESTEGDIGQGSWPYASFPITNPGVRGSISEEAGYPYLDSDGPTSAGYGLAKLPPPGFLPGPVGADVLDSTGETPNQAERNWRNGSTYGVRNHG